MRITTIRLFNFRSIEELTLDVSGEGLHAITGSFGAGKSSFFTAVRWCLFGDAGDAGTNVDLRRRGSDERADAGAEVTFTHGQDIFIARRWMRRSNTKTGVKEKVFASLSINGNPVDGIGARSLTREMEDCLGMTAKAFAGASMIPQGEVATLMKATPVEVQALVEEHTGIAPLTKARDIARKQATDAEAKADALPGTEEDVVVAQNQLNEANREVENCQQRVNEIQAELNKASQLRQDLDNQVRALRDAERAEQQAREKVAVAQARLEDARSEEAEVADKARQAGIAIGGDLAQVFKQARADAEDKSRRIQRISDLVAGARTAQSHKDAASVAVDKADAVEQRALDAADEASASRQQWLQELDDSKSDEVEMERSIRDVFGQASVHEATAVRLRKAIGALQSAGQGHSCCPTCQHELDDVEGLIQTMQEEAAQAQADYETVSHRGAVLEQQRKAAQSAIHELRNKIGVAEARMAEADNAARQAEEARGRDISAQRSLEQALHTLADALNVSATTQPKELFTQAQASYRQLQDDRDRILATCNLLESVTAVTQRVRRATQQLHDAQAAAQQVSAPTVEQIHHAEQQAVQAAQAEQETSTALSEANSHLYSAKSVLTVVTMTAEEEQARWDKKQSAVRQALIARGKANAIVALRSELLAESTKAICRGASDLLASFGGEYVAFHLDEDFVPRAELADGRLVRTSVLSGGESALVGLAFRVGITLRLTSGGLPEQVLCDEVTNYLDEQGRRSVLAALNNLFSSVVLISHTQEALDFATHVHSMVRSSLGATHFEGQEVLDETSPDHRIAA